MSCKVVVVVWDSEWISLVEEAVANGGDDGDYGDYQLYWGRYMCGSGLVYPYYFNF